MTNFFESIEWVFSKGRRIFSKKMEREILEEEEWEEEEEEEEGGDEDWEDFE